MSPQNELRQRGVFDSGGSLIGYVENIYVDEEGTFRFVDVAMGGFMLGDPHTAPEEGLQRGAHQSLAKNSGGWGAWQ